MKLKLTSLLVALGLLTNAAFAGNSAKIGYASDFFYRGGVFDHWNNRISCYKDCWKCLSFW